MKATKNFVKGLMVLLLTAAATTASAKGPKGDSVVDVAESIRNTTGEFSLLLTALELTGLDEVLDGRNGQVTVFAPTDAAFLALPPMVLADLLADPEALTQVLLYHVAKGRRDGEQVAASDQIRMFNGDFIGVDFDGNTITLSDAAALPDPIVVGTNDDAANGIIHVINHVLVPEL